MFFSRSTYRVLTESVSKICRILCFLAILIVTSYVGHDDVRSAHRAAISKAELAKVNVLRVFLLAEIPAQEKFIRQEAIENEHQHFNDIVQGLCALETLPELFTLLIVKSPSISIGNFIEAYRNLPYKHVMGLRWASFHKCLRPTFIIKMDDDIVVDFVQLFAYILEQKQKLAADMHFLAGYIFRHVQPIRRRQNKWFVSEDEFSGNEYPDYLSGWLYVTIPKTARALVVAASEPFTPIFWIDDTWITGILREKRLIPIDDSLNERFSANSQFLDCCIADMQKHKYKCPFLAGPNGADHALIKKFNEAVRRHCLLDQNDGNDDRKSICIDRPPNHPSIKETCVGGDKHLLQENHGAAVISAFRLK